MKATHEMTDMIEEKEMKEDALSVRIRHIAKFLSGLSQMEMMESAKKAFELSSEELDIAANRLERQEKMVKSLERIREMAMEHACFDLELFESRNIDELVNVGGDVCDWTMIAIIASDALEGIS